MEHTYLCVSRRSHDDYTNRKGGEEEDERKKNPERAHTAVELLNSPELQLLSLYSQPVKVCTLPGMAPTVLCSHYYHYFTAATTDGYYYHAATCSYYYAL